MSAKLSNVKLHRSPVKTGAGADDEDDLTESTFAANAFEKLSASMLPCDGTCCFVRFLQRIDERVFHSFWLALRFAVSKDLLVPDHRTD